MCDTSGFRRWWRPWGLVFTVVAIAMIGEATESAGTRQSEALADLTARIVGCSVHPCLGDGVKAVREALHGAIVTDDLYYYSDVVVAFPSVSGTLQGLVEWDLDGPLESISLKITPKEGVVPASICIPGPDWSWSRSTSGAHSSSVPCSDLLLYCGLP